MGVNVGIVSVGVGVSINVCMSVSVRTNSWINMSQSVRITCPQGTSFKMSEQARGSVLVSLQDILANKVCYASNVSIYMYMYICVCVCLFVYTCICIHVYCMYVYNYVRMYIRIWEYIHLYMGMWVRLMYAQLSFDWRLNTLPFQVFILHDNHNHTNPFLYPKIKDTSYTEKSQ